MSIIIVINEEQYTVNPDDKISDLITKLAIDDDIGLEICGESLDINSTWNTYWTGTDSMIVDVKHSRQFYNNILAQDFNKKYGPDFDLRAYADMGNFNDIAMIIAGIGEGLVFDIIDTKNAELLKAAIDAGIDLNIMKYARTPLMCARKTDQIRILLDAGADADEGGVMGWTPLMRALDVEQTTMLINAGANASKRCNCGRTALMPVNDVKQITALVNAGADINAVDDYNMTPLMLAQNAAQTKELIDLGVDIHCRDLLGRSALDLMKHEDQKQLLIAAGAE